MAEGRRGMATRRTSTKTGRAGNDHADLEVAIPRRCVGGGSLGRLYAMGVDAYRLAPRLGQLKTLPESQVDGLTGTLSLSPSQRIQRQLPWAEFRDGQVQRLPDSLN